MNDQDRKNRDFVAILVDFECSWNFFTPIEAETATAYFDEFLDVLDRFLSTTDDFAIPIRVEYPAAVFEEDIALSTVFETGAPSVQKHVERRSVESDEGLTYQAIVDDIPTGSEAVHHIYEFDLNFKTHIILEDWAGYVHRGSYPRCRLWKTGRVVDGRPRSEPVRVKLMTSKDRRNDGPTFYLKIMTSTDIWFEETDIGKENRTRLRSLLTRVQDEFDVTETIVDTNKYPKDDLRDLIE